MTPPPRRTGDTANSIDRNRHIADHFIGMLLGFARDRIDVTGIRLKTRGYLQLAVGLGLEDDPDPKAQWRVEPDWPAFGFAKQVVAEYRGPRTFRLGPSFCFRGPTGPITIEEDKS